MLQNMEKKFVLIILEVVIVVQKFIEFFSLPINKMAAKILSNASEKTMLSLCYFIIDLFSAAYLNCTALDL